MKQIKIKAGLLLACSFSVVALATAPVMAHETSTGTGSGSDSGSLNSKHTDDTVQLASESPSGTDSASDQAESSGTLRQQAEELLKTKRQNVKNELTQDKKQKACEAHKTEINKRANNYASAAQKHLGVFNDIFTKLQNFYTSKGLNVSNYDTLVADATAKQTAAATAVQALKDADVSIDCTSTDPASTVATLKVTVANARQALKDYRTSLKNLVVAFKGASTSTTGKSDDTSDNDTTTTNETTTSGGN
jgi:hypothetical protein